MRYGHEMHPETAREILEETRYQRPQYHIGEEHHGTYVVASTHRDADLLTRANWKEWTQTILREAIENGDAYVARAGHWAVGYVETLHLMETAPTNHMIAAAATLSALHDYPILNEETFSEMECNEAEEAWEEWGKREAAGMIARALLSLGYEEDEASNLGDSYVEDDRRRQAFNEARGEPWVSHHSSGHTQPWMDDYADIATWEIVNEAWTPQETETEP
jgi:hypothetical protein